MRTLRLVLGSCLVYAIVAACSATSGPRGAFSTDGGLADALGGAADALTDPVPSAAADPYQSGSRLKAQYWAGEDGTKSFASWYDTQRQETCDFQTAADGTTRCLPSGIGAGGAYADSGCTQPIGITSAGCAAPKYIRAYSNASCGTGGLHIYSVGSTFTGTPYVGMPGSCTAGGLSPSFTYYTLGAEVPPTSFVAATLQQEP